ncbi:smile protein [Culex quinquefasciatus]|uniref:Smile protein n=1 Tax=Culex quinquefasciatus TaxID=7176 RepID=B0XLV3_CULQU|nr:smile protein [Culex quinquefasciatus]|eukprot:XP_001870624.1 smile protein [Culex quinquefasciatus]
MQLTFDCLMFSLKLEWMTFELSFESYSSQSTNITSLYSNSQLGVVFLEQGKASQALAYLDKALEFDPEHEQALLNSAILLQELGRPELRKIARERLLKLLAKDESNERVHFNLGMLAMDDRNTDEAENWTSRSALFNLALLLADDHRPLEAAPFLNQLVKYHPDHIKGLILLGDIYINNIKDLDAAENCYKRILQLDPINIQGLHNLCVVYVERGKLAQAQSCLAHAHRLAPGEDYILRHLQIVQTRIQRLRTTAGPSREKEVAFAEYDPREFGGSPGDELEDDFQQQPINGGDGSSNDNHNNLKTSLPHVTTEEGEDMEEAASSNIVELS